MVRVTLGHQYRKGAQVAGVELDGWVGVNEGYPNALAPRRLSHLALETQRRTYIYELERQPSCAPRGGLMGAHLFALTLVIGTIAAGFNASVHYNGRAATAGEL